MFAVYEVYDSVFGYDVAMVGESFETEAEAEAYMAELVAEDLEEYGVSGEYYVDEVEEV